MGGGRNSKQFFILWWTATLMLYVHHTVAPLQLVLTLNFLKLDLKQVGSQTLSPFFAKFRNPVIIADLENTVILIFFYDTNIFLWKLQPGGMRFRFFFMTLSLICCWIEMVLLAHMVTWGRMTEYGRGIFARVHTRGAKYGPGSHLTSHLSLLTRGAWSHTQGPQWSRGHKELIHIINQCL